MRGGRRESSARKTLVLPDPVGKETPILEIPLDKASRQDWTHDSWYGLSTSFERIDSDLALNVTRKAWKHVRSELDIQTPASKVSTY